MRQIAEQILSILQWRKERLTLAESCTGGMIAAAITSVPGASRNFYGGFVTYTNEAKQHMIGVSEDVLMKYGAVSPECAKEMALGALNTAGVEYAVSVTGLAGPGGATAEQPVGLVYIAIAEHDNVYVQQYNFSGTREQIRSQAAIAALGLLLALLKKGYIDEK